MRLYLRLGFLLSLVLLYGCSRGDFGNYASLVTSFPRFGQNEYNIEYDRMETAESSIAQSSLDELNRQPAQDQTRKLIRRARIQIQAADQEALERTVAAAMQEHGAYSEHTMIRENQRTYTIRVPEHSYQSLIEALKGMGRLISYSENIEDVTLRYFDLEGRLHTMRELRDTFQAYLRTARTIDEIMSVETRLAEVQRDIDQIGTQLRFLSNQVDYATIDFDIRLPALAGRNIGQDLEEKIRELIGGFRTFASTLILIFLGILIYGIPILLILVLLYWLLFGRIGLIKRAWRIASKKSVPAGRGH